MAICRSGNNIHLLESELSLNADDDDESAEEEEVRRRLWRSFSFFLSFADALFFECLGDSDLCNTWGQQFYKLQMFFPYTDWNQIYEDCKNDNYMIKEMWVSSTHILTNTLKQNVKNNLFWLF